MWFDKLTSLKLEGCIISFPDVADKILQYLEKPPVSICSALSAQSQSELT
jgi:hypothetical protein